jgi:segregation and condensation protein A
MISSDQNLASEAFAWVAGEPLNSLPQDLYIPPQALQVFLENFSGPLDLLLYLIRKQNIDILDIPIAKITEQYMEYIALMQVLNLELAAEYLLMAAILAEIKSRLLLPKPAIQLDGTEIDPRVELVEKLKEYEKYKKLAEELDSLPRLERDSFLTNIESAVVRSNATPLPNVKLDELYRALQELMERAKLFEHHQISREQLSVRDRMSHIIKNLQSDKFTSFHSLFNLEEGRRGVVVTFVAILELLRQSIIEIVQVENFGPIHVRATLGIMNDEL